MPCLLAQSDAATVAMFYVFALLAAASAVGVVVSRNIVRMAVFLLFTLVGVAGLYLLLHAEFLAAVQVVVYAGGTLILIVFGIMLTSKSPFVRFQPTVGEAVTALAIALVLLIALAMGIHRGIRGGMLAQHPVPPAEGYPMARLGQVLLGDYLLPFEIASVLLLVVMIGAAYLAKARRRPTQQGQAQAPAGQVAP